MLLSGKFGKWDRGVEQVAQVERTAPPVAGMLAGDVAINMALYRNIR